MQTTFYRKKNKKKRFSSFFKRIYEKFWTFLIPSNDRPLFKQDKRPSAEYESGWIVLDNRENNFYMIMVEIPNREIVRSDLRLI